MHGAVFLLIDFMSQSWLEQENLPSKTGTVLTQKNSEDALNRIEGMPALVR